jgi:hypothetical protein
MGSDDDSPVILLDDPQYFRERHIATIPTERCRPTRVRKQTEEVIPDVHLESREDPERVASDLGSDGAVLFDEMSQEALPVLPVGAEVVVGDPDDLQADLVAAPQIPSCLVLEILLVSLRRRADDPQGIQRIPMPAVLRRLNLEVTLEPAHALVVAHQSGSYQRKAGPVRLGPVSQKLE